MKYKFLFSMMFCFATLFVFGQEDDLLLNRVESSTPLEDTYIDGIVKKTLTEDAMI